MARIRLNQEKQEYIILSDNSFFLSIIEKKIISNTCGIKKIQLLYRTKLFPCFRGFYLPTLKVCKKIFSGCEMTSKLCTLICQVTFTCLEKLMHIQKLPFVFFFLRLLLSLRIHTGSKFEELKYESFVNIFFVIRVFIFVHVISQSLG